jgi:hypothetical protein
MLLVLKLSIPLMQSTKLSGQPIICQLLSFLPKELVQQSVAKFGSDKYYKTMDTYKQLTFMLYGIVSKSRSLTSLCKCLLFLEGKLSYLGITKLPAVSTLSDANCNRKSEVFQDIYYHLLEHYKPELAGGFACLPINGEASCKTIKRFDSTTFTLFSDIFKGAGRNTDSGHKKGGVKAQTLLAFDSLVPEYVELGAACKNDKDFLGQLVVKKRCLYVFDKGYDNYQVYKDWTDKGVFFLTRLNENASFSVLEDKPMDHMDIVTGTGIQKDQTIQLKLKGSKEGLRLRLVTYKDPVSGKLLHFLTNQTSYKATTIALIYKNRWAIEPFFKQLKQNYQLSYFYSDDPEGIMTQIWIAFIANLIFTLIFQRNKEAETFVTIVSMARSGMRSYVCFLSIIKRGNLTPTDRDREIIQFKIFQNSRGGHFEDTKNIP